MRDFGESVVMGILAMLVVGVAVLWYSYSCSESASMMGLPSNYGISTGCMVKKQGAWLPLKAIRAVD